MSSGLVKLTLPIDYPENVAVLVLTKVDTSNALLQLMLFIVENVAVSVLSKVVIWLF